MGISYQWLLNPSCEASQLDAAATLFPLEVLAHPNTTFPTLLREIESAFGRYPFDVSDAYHRTCALKKNPSLELMALERPELLSYFNRVMVAAEFMWRVEAIKSNHRVNLYCLLCVELWPKVRIELPKQTMREWVGFFHAAWEYNHGRDRGALYKAICYQIFDEHEMPVGVRRACNVLFVTTVDEVNSGMKGRQYAYLMRHIMEVDAVISRERLLFLLEKSTSTPYGAQSPMIDLFEA